MTDPRLSRAGAERFAAAAEARRTAAGRGPNPDSVTLTATGAILRYRPEDIGTFKGVEFFAQDCEWEVGRDGEDIEYPYVDGGTSEDTGRLRWKGTITTRWFGTDWLRRLENFIGVIESRSEPGDLQLPGGFARINAKIWRGNVSKAGGRNGAAMKLTFSEQSYAAFVYMYDAASSPATQAEDLAAGTGAEEWVDAYAESVRDPDASPEDNLAALQNAEQSLDDEDATTDASTPEGQERLDRTALCRDRMYEAFPDQDYLEASG
jgi:hypothetical protein